MKPGHETSPSAGSAIPDAATAGTPTASAMTRRSWTGTLAAPNTGAARKAAPGRIIASIQSWSIASTLGMSAGFIARLSHQRRNLRIEVRSEEHTSELQSLMRISYAVFCLKKTQQQYNTTLVIQS